MENEDLAECQPLTRLFFVYLWMLADRDGRLEDRPKRIAIQALPYDRTADVDAMLEELAAAGFILRYRVAGKPLIQILTFAKHQTPHIREVASELPGPEQADANPEQSTTKVVPEHDLGCAEASPRLLDSLIVDSLIPDTGLGTGAQTPQEIPEPEKLEPREKSAARGTRLPRDWTLPDDWIREAIGIQPAWTAARCKQAADVFRDYWVAQPGQKGVKADWLATWRNWVRRDTTGPPRNNGDGHMTPYQRMQVEKHEERKRFNQEIFGRSGDAGSDAIDGTAERLD